MDRDRGRTGTGPATLLTMPLGHAVVSGLDNYWELNLCMYCFVIVKFIVGLKSMGMTKTLKVCDKKISPIEILTISGLSMLKKMLRSFPLHIQIMDRLES